MCYESMKPQVLFEPLCAGPTETPPAKASEAPSPVSPATTVPGTDEQARAMAVEFLQQQQEREAADTASAMQTPQEKIRRMPATPNLVRQMSVPIFGNEQHGTSQIANSSSHEVPANTATTGTPENSHTANVEDKSTGEQKTVKPSKGTTVKGKKGVAKGKKGKNKGKKAKGKKVVKGQKTKQGKTHNIAKAGAPPSAATGNHPSVPTEPVVPKQEPCEHEQKSTGPVAKKTEPPANMAAVVKTEPPPTMAVDKALPAAHVPAPASAAVVQPSAVQSVLNRSQTVDMASPSPASAPPANTADTSNKNNANTGQLEGSIAATAKEDPLMLPSNPRQRDKEVHNRRMRFYRSLDSF